MVAARCGPWKQTAAVVVAGNVAAAAAAAAEQRHHWSSTTFVVAGVVETVADSRIHRTTTKSRAFVAAAVVVVDSVAEADIHHFAKRAGATKGTLAKDRKDWTVAVAAMHTRTVVDAVIAKETFLPLS
jgi:hypothetical protein